MEKIDTMFRELIGAASESPVSLEPSQKAKSKLKKRSLIFGMVIIIIIAVASIYALSQFPILGVGAKAPELKLDYSVGEKMTYEIDVGMQALGTKISETITLEMEVQNFDGENYTVNYTILAGMEEQSFILKMNETGHMIQNSELPNDLDEIFSYFLGVPGFGTYLTGEEVSVGDNWEIPFDFPEIDFEGKMSFLITEEGKVEVPAGKYDVLKISAESSGLNVEVEGVQVSLEVDGVLSLEKDTCRLVDLDSVLTLETILEDQTTSIDINIEMTLTEHLK